MPDATVVERLFHEALALPPEERAAFLAAHAPDEATRIEVLELLAEDADLAAPLRAAPDAFAAAAGLVAADDVAPPLTGRTLGPYRILEPIGQGGMGTVYRAVREDLGNQVALKVIRGAMGDPARLARFRQEQRVLARLEHDHIARLIDVGVAPDETPFLVMEYVQGTPITDWCDERGLDVEARLRLFLDVCDAVAYAHRHAVVHRDIKPSNVLVTTDGRAKLLDFGVAKLLEGDDVDTTLTATSVRILSPTYAAPEQFGGEAITTATDVYGLGALLYELLAGVPHRAPVTGGGPVAWAASLENDVVPPSVAARRVASSNSVHGNELRYSTSTTSTASGSNDAASASARARRIAGDLDAICLRALEHDPARRYAAVELLRDDVARYLAGQPVDARLPTLGYRAGKFVRRNAVAVATAAAVILLLIVGLVAVTWQARRAERALAVSEELVDYLVGLFDSSDPGTMQGRTVTAVELLEEGTRRARQLDARPEVQTRLLDAMARAHLGLGDFDRADSLAALALDREREVSGEGHAGYADRLYTLARTRRALGQLVEAEALMREALALHRRTLGDLHDRTTVVMIDLAYLLHERRGHDEAEALAREALDARIAMHGPVSRQAADALDALASMLWTSGKDLPRAEQLYREAARVSEQIGGPHDLQLAESLLNLAGMLPVVGKAAEAEAVAWRAIEIRRAVYGDDHPETIHAYNQLASAIQAQGRTAEARGYYHEVLRRYAGLYDGDHPLVAVVTNNLSHTFYAEGALDSAGHYLRKALDMRMRLFGPMDANVALYQHNLGSLLRAQGDLVSAEPVMAEAYRLRAAIHGEDNLITLRSGAAYGGILAELGKLDEAEALLRDILERQQVPEAEGTQDAAITMGLLAGILARRGEYVEAESLYLPALQVLRERMPPTYPRRREIVAGLISIYEATNRAADAARLRQEESASIPDP